MISSHLAICSIKFAYAYFIISTAWVQASTGGAETCLSLSHHDSRLQGCNIFPLRQFFIIIPANESGQVTAIFQQRPCWKRLQGRQCGEPGEKDNNTGLSWRGELSRWSNNALGGLFTKQRLSLVTSGLKVGSQGYGSGSFLAGVHRYGNLCCTLKLLQSRLCLR